MGDRQRVLTKFGYASPAVSLSCILLSTFVDPKFSWRTRALSDIGEATETTVFALTLDQVAFNLFNGGLILSGLLGLPFLIALWQDAQVSAERVGIGLAGVTMVSSAGVGVAYLDGPFKNFHFLAASLVFLGTALALYNYSAGLLQRSDGEHGQWLLWLTNLYVFTWVAWGVVAATLPESQWFAVPEFTAALVFAFWAVSQARRLLAKPTQPVKAETS